MQARQGTIKGLCKCSITAKSYCEYEIVLLILESGQMQERC